MLQGDEKKGPAPVLSHVGIQMSLSLTLSPYLQYVAQVLPSPTGKITSDIPGVFLELT